MKKLFVTLSAVPLSMARPYLKNFKRHYPEIFDEYGSGKVEGKKDRIYIPLGSDVSIKSLARKKPPKEIVEFLESKGYEVENYMTGKARKGKRTVRIGPILKEEAPELLKIFETDPSRKSAKRVTAGAMAVISRHPYDIIGSSFDRGWNSCMNLKNGINKEYLKHDVEEGSLVAYMIKQDDKNINNPIARVLLKPFINIDDDGETVILAPDTSYGDAGDLFKEVIMKFAVMMAEGKPEGLYQLNPKLYNDGHTVLDWDGDSLDVTESSEYLDDAAMHTNNRQLLDRLAHEGYTNIIYNPNSNKKNFRALWEHAEEMGNTESGSQWVEEFVSNCEYYDLLVDLEIDIETLTENFRGTIESTEEAEEWLRSGGEPRRVEKKLLIALLEEMQDWDEEDQEIASAAFDDLPYFEDGEVDMEKIIPMLSRYEKFANTGQFNDSAVIRVVKWLLDSVISDDEDEPEEEFDSTEDYINRKHYLQDALDLISDALTHVVHTSDATAEKIADMIGEHCKDFKIFQYTRLNVAFGKYSELHRGLTIPISKAFEFMPNKEEDKKLYLRGFGLHSPRTLLIAKVQTQMIYYAFNEYVRHNSASWADVKALAEHVFKRDDAPKYFNLLLPNAVEMLKKATPETANIEIAHDLMNS